MPIETVTTETGVEQATVMKFGENCLQLRLQRTAKGLRVMFKTNRALEDFMHQQSGGQKIPVESLGRFWVPAEEGKTLEVYKLPQEFLSEMSESVPYTLNQVGLQLFQSPSNPTANPNISFIRLVGASEGVGADFYIKGVYTKERVAQMRDALARSVRDFYSDFLTPIDMVAVISLQRL